MFSIIRILLGTMDGMDVCLQLHSLRSLAEYYDCIALRAGNAAFGGVGVAEASRLRMVIRGPSPACDGVDAAATPMPTAGRRWHYPYNRRYNNVLPIVSLLPRPISRQEQCALRPPCVLHRPKSPMWNLECLFHPWRPSSSITHA